jgi:hypothetical protein
MPTALVFSTGSNGYDANNLSNNIGTERMRLDSTGRLGLGTGSPGTKLDVVGDIGFSSGNDGGACYLKHTTGNANSRSWRIINDASAFGDYAIQQSTTQTGSTYSTRLYISSSGNVGIGTTSPTATLTFGNAVDGTASSPGKIRLYDDGNSIYGFGVSAGQLNYRTGGASDSHVWFAGTSERARIDSSGRLLVGTSTARDNFLNTTGNGSRLQVEGIDFPTSSAALIRNSSDAGGAFCILAKSRGSTIGSNTVVIANDTFGTLSFQGSDGTEFVEGARIRAEVDGTPGANDMPGRLVFSTTADGASSPTERMRIRADGATCLGFDFFAGGNFTKASVQDGSVSGKMIDVAAGASQLYSSRNTTSAANHIVFYNPNGAVGSISTSASATSYTTSSDYRLKENVVPLTGAVDRLNQLQVRSFNFIADPDTVVDGFIAHEAAEVVPECVTGTKDAVDEDGNPIYQGIDQSKIVPLLTAALQEALAKIETLEARLDAAGIS